ncbi:hypothetical protein D3C87_1545750 [compost metagenome]
MLALNAQAEAAIAAIAKYESDQTLTSKVELASVVSQLSGTAGFALGMTVGSPALFYTGSVLTSVGNIITLSSLLTEENATKILEQIAATRAELKSLSEDIY